jgi:hypothetical protein
MRSIHLFPLCLLLACGDNKDKQRPPDGGLPIDALVDMMVPECTYTEMADATNDDLFGSGTPENTGISFTNQTRTICGQFNMGQYNTTRMNIDVDSYTFTVPSATTGILYLTAPGAEALDSVLIEIYGDTVGEIGQFVGTFAAASARLPPDTYSITVSAYDGMDTTMQIDYKIRLQLDPPTRCPKSTATPAFTEANEGVAGGGNDVYQVFYGSGNRGPTMDALDAPEPTNITVEPSTSYRVSGTASTFTVAPESWSDSFMDRDTYAITMGANTNQLSLRVNWPGNTTDFDFFVFPMEGVIEIAQGWYMGNMEDEFSTFAVTPGATYWVMVGAVDGSTGFPIDYDLTFCGDTFTP